MNIYINDTPSILVQHLARYHASARETGERHARWGKVRFCRSWSAEYTAGYLEGAASRGWSGPLPERYTKITGESITAAVREHWAAGDYDSAVARMPCDATARELVDVALGRADIVIDCQGRRRAQYRK